jgi:lysophospholipase L1-like esterase
MRVYYFGDSIMAQDGKEYTYSADYNHSEIGKICAGYPTLLKKYFNIDEKGNFAVGGHVIKKQAEVILSKDFSAVDLVFIAAGVNDFSFKTPLGKLPLSTEREHDATFIGTYCTAMDYIYRSNPKIKAVLMTPLHRDTLNRAGNVPKSAIDTNINGHTLIDYVNAVKEIGAFYACPVADMYSNSGLNRFNMSLYTFEGVHPTNAGYEYIMGELISAVKKVIF